ncbi:MAG: tetratricopeptide repeat protein [Gemmataceae bacterium]|nr:tetratricopeptide repeat protein [Gemmataceae bacterium]
MSANQEAETTGSAPSAPGLPIQVSANKRRLALAGLLVLIVVAAAGAWIYVRFGGDADYRAVQDALARRDFQEASRRLQKYLDAKPGDRAVRLLTAQTARRQGDFQDAASHLQIYENHAGADADVDQERRLLRIQQGNLIEAEATLAWCAKNPNALQTPLMLEALIEGCLSGLWATLQCEMAGQGEVSPADFARAQRAIDQWLAQRPGQPDQVQGHVWLGKLHSVARDYPKAHAAFRKAVDLDPQSFAARELLGLSLLHDAPAEAALHLQALHQRDPANAKISYFLATVRRTLGELEAAAQLLDAVLAQQPEHVPALVERGRVALDQRHAADAELWLHRAMTLAPNHAQANMIYSQCLQQADRAAEAKRYHDRFLEIEAEVKRQRDEMKKRS